MEGGQSITAVAPLDKIPVFVKAGSIIPAGEVVQYTSQKPGAPITLYVFAGDDASFAWYEDEGVNYNYEDGKYAIVDISYSENNGSLTLGQRQHSFDGMEQKREIRIVYVTKDHPKGIDLTDTPDQIINYTGEPLTLKLKD